MRLKQVLAAGIVAAALAPAALAQPANELIVAVPQEPPSNDVCAMASSAAARVLFANVGEGLTTRDYATGELKSLLATAWKQTSPMTWEFTLRQGVVFHDGAPFNAENAVKSIQRTFIPQLNCSVATQAFGAIKLTAEAVGEYTLKITTSQEDPILPRRTVFLGMASPASPTDRPAVMPVGTGPYKLTRWDRGTRIVFERNAQYWGAAPPSARVTYLFRGEDLVRANMVERGEADVAIGLPSEFSKNKGAVSIDVPSVVGLRVHTFSAPYNDMRVRQAVKLALDRKGLIAAVWDGAGSVASQPITNEVVGYDAGYPEPKYDPDAARKLIAAAKADGVKVDTPAAIFTRMDILDNADILAQGLAQQLNDIGLNVKVQVMEAGPWIELLRTHPTDRPGFLLEPHNNGLGDGSWTANSKYHSSQGRSQVPEAQRATVDDMIKRAGAAQGDERAKLYRELFAYLDREVIQDVFIARTRSVMVLGARVKYSPVAPSDDIVPLALIMKQ
jgi:peptide/nickel transport system substrate-binding protein